MSVIGPRPGLWNQDILTAERDKYNANDVKPGLTGCLLLLFQPDCRGSRLLLHHWKIRSLQSSCGQW